MNGCITLGDPSRVNRLKPVIRVENGDWERCSETEVIETPDGRAQLQFECRRACNEISAAFCYPYTLTDFERTLRELCISYDTVGLTSEGRALPRIRIGKGEPGVYIVARQHSGETPGSWVLDGLIRRASQTELALWVVPFVDLDAVERGDYGKDSLPRDFNRAWEFLPMRPEVRCIQRDMYRFAKRHKPRLLLDLHAPSHHEDGVYVFYPRISRSYEQRRTVESFVALLSEEFREIGPDSLGRECGYASRWDPDCTATNWVWDRLDKTLGICIETSYQSLAGVPLDIEGYREIDRRFLHTILKWFKIK